MFILIEELIRRMGRIRPIHIRSQTDVKIYAILIPPYETNPALINRLFP